MNKIIIVLLCLLLLTSCNKKQVIESEEDDNVTTNDVIESDATVLDSLDYSLGDGLPTLHFDSRTIEDNLSEDDKQNDMVASYYVLDENLSITIFRYKTNGHTIQEALDAQINVYYPNQDLVGYVFNDWKGEYSSSYGYYMAYDTLTYGEPYYVQTYIFVDGEDFVQADYWYKTTRINIIDGIHFDMPLSLYEKSDDINIEDGEILKYINKEYSGAPTILFNIHDNVEDTYEQIISNYQEKFNLIEYEEYSYTENDIEYNNLYLAYYDNENPSIKKYEFLSLLDSKLYSVCFENDTNYGLFNAVGIPSILNSINSK